MPFANVKTALPGPRSQELIERWKRPRLTRRLPGRWSGTRPGAIVTDVDGNTYLDWTSGVLVGQRRSCSSHLVRAICESSEKLLNNYECPRRTGCWRPRTGRRLPPHMDKCFFLSTGSETVEAAVRLMKRMTGRFEIIGFHGGFHGRTMPRPRSAAWRPETRLRPPMPGVIRAPFPISTLPVRLEDRTGVRGQASGAVGRRRAVRLVRQPGRNSGETYQGAAGFISRPRLPKRVQDWGRAQGLLFTIDEVQSSYGRMGAMWGHTLEGLEPDLMCIGKGIGSGYPVAAIAGRGDVFACLAKGEMSQHAGGNPVGSRRVVAVLEIMERENLCENARNMGEVIIRAPPSNAREVEALGRRARPPAW